VVGLHLLKELPNNHLIFGKKFGIHQWMPLEQYPDDPKKIQKRLNFYNNYHQKHLLFAHQLHIHVLRYNYVDREELQHKIYPYIVLEMNPQVTNKQHIFEKPAD